MLKALTFVLVVLLALVAGYVLHSVSDFASLAFAQGISTPPLHQFDIPNAGSLLRFDDTDRNVTCYAARSVGASGHFTLTALDCLLNPYSWQHNPTTNRWEWLPAPQAVPPVAP